MKNKTLLFFLPILFFITNCEKYGKHEWENPTIIGINKLPPEHTLPHMNQNYWQLRMTLADPRTIFH